MTLSILFLLALFGGCSYSPVVETPSTSNFPVTERTLVVRKSHPGKLTYKRLSEMDIYDLSDEKTRHMLDDHDFMCDVSGRSFYICRDRPGYCRYTYEKSCFLFFCGKKKQTVEYRDSTKDHDFLVAGGTKCERISIPSMSNAPR